MSKLFIIILILFTFNEFCQAQTLPIKSYIFDGYVMTPDSMPVEGAFLINYRNSKIVATDHSGYFKMTVESGDSVMVNHVSMSPQVVQVHPTYIDKAKIFVEYRTYMVNPITTYDEEKQRSNLDQSMDQLNEDIQKQILVDPTKRTGNDNTYNDNVANPGATIIRVTPTVSKKDKLEKRDPNDR
ncbi:hypothetical protein [Mangrovibacterium marinum]|uniref:Carboxypeptidase-like protein n=1 Tax=Mangrovibacterium marinum TaxID=1639118 RepID=A0A2T5C0L7_9BACT|nr:hypothetical protein [Mangrovibacterium marinum]PTN08131.1 hypothetical protein C8N47_11017 [Mangrovibacterium marinum]